MSSLLDDITTRGAEIRTRLRELLLRHKYRGDDTKNMVLAAYVDIALEHHKAIWLLSESGLNGSALALVRPILDAYFRALWINEATPEDIEKASRDEPVFPRMSKMRDDIKKAYFPATASKDAKLTERAKQIDGFFQLLEDAWTTLHSYTHPGGLAIVRRFRGDKVKPKYSEGEIAEALNAAIVWLMWLLQMFFASMGRRDEALETRTLFIQYSAQFNERLQSGRL